MPSPVEEFRVNVKPQTPEEFAAMRKRQERRERIENSEAGFSQNQENLDYFGGGVPGFVKSVAASPAGAVTKVIPGVDIAMGAYGAVKGVQRSIENFRENDGVQGVDLSPELPTVKQLPGVGAATDMLNSYMLYYGVFNTAGSTAALMVNAPAIAAGVTKPGENYKPALGVLGGGVGNAGGQELNPYLKDGVQLFTDITDTWNLAWDNDITIGQSGGLQIGRTANQLFYDEETDERILEDSLRHFADPKNERNLYSANIGLSSAFDLTDTRMIDSATNQSWGRWVTGGIDAAVAWFWAPEVLGAKVAAKGIRKATTVFMANQGDRTAFRKQFELGKLFDATGGAQGRRTAAWDLAVQLSKMPKKYIAKHEIADQTTNPQLVADILGATKTPDDAFDALMALGGDMSAIGRIRARMNSGLINIEGKNMSMMDALTQAARRNAEMRDDIAEMSKLRDSAQKVGPQKVSSTGQVPIKGLSDDVTPGFKKSLTPIFDREIKQMESKADELQGVIDEALEGFQVKLDRAVDIRTGVTRGNVRIDRLSGVKGGMSEVTPMFDGTNKVARMGKKAEKRYQQVTGEGVWTSTEIQAGGKWGRTVRLIHSGADYMKTQKIRGFARTSDAKDSLIEMTNALNTNPLLRKLTRTMSTRVGGRLDDAPVDEYMPSSQRVIDEKMENYSPEDWDEFMASGEFSAWVSERGLLTASQFRAKYYERMLGATSEKERALIFDQFEEQMFYEMAESYGMPREKAMQVLENYTAMKNKVATQIRDRGWYWDKSSDEAHVIPQLQSALSENKELLDFRFMDRVFRISQGGIKGGTQQVRMSVSRVLSTIDSIWRPLVLMRLGYTLRNVAESNLREMAYTNSIVGVKGAKGSIKGDMKWVDLAANTADRLSRVGRAAYYSPLHPDIPGTLRAMRKSLDDELTLSAKRNRLLDELRENRKNLEAKKQSRIDKARRDAALKIVRESAATRRTGESYVWQQVTDHIADRKRFFTSIDEIILDPGATETLEQAGWGTGLRANDALAGVRTDSPTLALAKSLQAPDNNDALQFAFATKELEAAETYGSMVFAVKPVGKMQHDHFLGNEPGTDFMSREGFKVIGDIEDLPSEVLNDPDVLFHGSDRDFNPGDVVRPHRPSDNRAPVRRENWKNYLSDSDRQYLEANTADSLEAIEAGVPSNPLVEQEMVFRALSTWLDLTGGEGGQVVRMINRQRGHFEVIHNPRKWFEDTVIGNEAEAEKILNDIRVIPKDSIDKIRGARVQVSGGILDLRPAGLGDAWHRTIVDPSVSYEEVWGRLFRFEELFADTPQAMFPKMVTMTDPMGGVGKYRTVVQMVEADRLKPFYIRGADDGFEWSDEAAAEMETPVILHAYGSPEDPILVVGDGQKRINAAYERGHALSDDSVKVPVTIRWMDEPESAVPDGANRMLAHMDSESKLAYFTRNKIDSAQEMRDNGGEFIHPSEFASQGKFPRHSESDRIIDRFNELGLGEDPSWQSVAKYFAMNIRGHNGRAGAMFLIDTARIAKAAELDPTVAQQVQIRLSDVTDPGLVQWWKDEGFLMPDREFRELVDSVVPLSDGDMAAQVRESMDVLNRYKSSWYQDINRILAEGLDASDHAHFISGMDWITQNTHTVTPGTTMRVYRASNYNIGTPKNNTYLSTSEIPGGVSVTGSNYRFGLDVQGGTPYASFKRLQNTGWESEHVFPRGVKAEFSHDEYIPELGHEMPIYKVWWDPNDNAALLTDRDNRWKQQVMGPQLGNNGKHPHPEVVEKRGPQLGGYTYGEHSGQWVDANGDRFYVKDYPEEVQGFLEHFFDTQTVWANTRQSTFLYIPEKGGYAYGSWMKPVQQEIEVIGDATSMTQAQARSLDNALPDLMADDILYMNFDALGPAGENMAFYKADFEQSPSPSVFKLDNGAIGPFRAHGETADWKNADVPWRSIIDNANSNGYRQLFRALAKHDEDRLSVSFSESEVDDYIEFFERRVAERLARKLEDQAERYGGPGNQLRGFYEAWKSNNPQAVSFYLDAQIEKMAKLYDARAQSLLQQLIDEMPSVYISAESLQSTMAKIAQRTGKREGAGGPIVPKNPDPIFAGDSRPAADIIRSVDNPALISESGHVADTAMMYAKQRGYGKIITPNPSKNRGYQVQVNSDNIYNGGDNVDATPAGWEAEAISANSQVLDMTRMTPVQIAESVGTDFVTATKGIPGLRNVKQLPHEVRARLAIRMQNEGYSYIALPNGKKVSQSELIGNDNVGAAYGAAIARDEVDAAAQVILSKDEAYTETHLKLQENESKIRAVESRLAERETEIKKLQDAMSKRRSKRQKEGGTTFSGSQVKEKLPYTVWRDGAWHQDEVEIESALGPQGSLYRQLISSNDRVAADMMGLGELTYRGMRSTRKELELTPYTEDYWRGLAEYGNKQLSNDPITEGIMDGLTDDRIIDIMFGTARGRSAIRNLDDFKEFRKYVSREELSEGLKDDMVALIHERRNFMDEYFSDPKLREIMRDEKKLLTADIMRDRIGTKPNLKPFLGHATEYEQSLHRRAISSIMYVLGTLPEDKLARSPFFRNRYRESMQEQVNIKAQQGQDEFGADELMQMSRNARSEALQILNDTLYTIQRVSTFADSMRLILPFFPAWASAARFWMYQIPKKNPENLVRYAMVDSAPDRAGWSVDDDNQRVEAPNGTAFALSRKLINSETYSIAFQVADDDLGWFEELVGPQSSMKLPKGSIDMMLQGEFPLIPTASPLVTVPVSFIGALRPDILTAIDETGDFTLTLGDDEEKLVTNGTLGEVLSSRVMPFGEPTREKDFFDAAVDQYAPAWLNKMITSIRGESSARFTAVANEIHRSRMTDWDLNDKTGPSPKYAEAVQDAHQFMWFRSAVNVTAPFSPMFQSKYQFYIDAWRDIQREGEIYGWSNDDKSKMFIDMYGKEFFRYTRSKSANMSGMAPDLGEYQAVTDYPELTGEIASIGEDAKFLSMLTKPFNQGEGFNSNVYAWQMNREIPGAAGRTFRGGIPERQLEIQSQMELGWYEYNRQVQRIEAVAEQKGYGKDVVDTARGRLVDRMALQPEYQDWYAEFQEINGGRWVDSVNALYLMLNDEKFMADNAPPEIDLNNFKADYANMTRQQQYVWTTQEFVKLRNMTIDLLEQQKASGGSGNIDAKQNIVLATYVDRKLMEMYALNTDFADMHRRYFGGDKYERTEDTAVTDD